MEQAFSGRAFRPGAGEDESRDPSSEARRVEAHVSPAERPEPRTLAGQGEPVSAHALLLGLPDAQAVNEVVETEGGTVCGTAAQMLV